jgi:1-acyl-sn-glycerol-3-phosphate acyltransferase
MMSSQCQQLEKSNPEEFLPPLTQETIQRAKQGVAYARDTSATMMTQQALSLAEAVAEGTDKKINGKIRRRASQILIRSLFQVKVEFAERIPNTPTLIAANHLNHIDPFLLFSELPASPYYHILGDARTLYNSWWKRQFLHLAKGVIPLERIWKEEIAVIEAAKNGRSDLTPLAEDIEKYVPKGNSIETMRRLDRIVQATFARGDGIMLFPEGRLGNKEGELLPLKRGAAIYALRSGVPILPVALIGTHNLYFRKELTIRIGEPIIIPQSHRPKPGEVQAVLNELQAAMVALLPKDYTEPKGAKPFRQFLKHLFW